MTLEKDTGRTLAGWYSPNASQEEKRLQFLEFLMAHPGDDETSGLWRTCLDGHITASVLIFNHERTHVLLTLHPKVGRWLQMGGHCEPGDLTIQSAALREGREESGIDDLTITPWPVLLDRHTVPCRPGVLLDHLDVQYAAVAAPGSQHAISSESLDLAWFALNGLPEDLDTSVHRLIQASTSHIAAI